MRLQRQFFGWHDPKRGFVVSRYPPDAPVRPSSSFETADEAITAVKRSYRAVILWIPPLPKGLLNHADQL
jgi:hypothetical protein